jgi:heparan-alpha-glucosaminide N-acetyltransferase
MMKTRIVSIDIFRALTMLLMIFVNDLWTLHDIPQWLEHTAAEEDGMGLADVVFPAFLFIVGLSIPFAIKARIKQGISRSRILQHILLRSLALVVMGFFMVNAENFSEDMPQWFKTGWELLMLIAFMLIWNEYETNRVFGKVPIRYLQIFGILLLFLLAVFYKGPESGEWMSPRWWGILGLIGWAYLGCALIYLLIGHKPWLIALITLILLALNAQEFFPLVAGTRGLRLIVSASNYALVMSGILATTLYLFSRNDQRKFLFPLLLLLPAIILLTGGFALRPLWGISKILATPSWTAICAGISFLAFGLIYLISDIYKSTRWAVPLMPAGRSTLTCYLLPGLVYPILWPLQQFLPQSFLGGGIGLLKSFLFAFLIILLTGLLEKIRIRMKI